MYNRIDNTRNVQSYSRFAEIDQLYVWNASTEIEFTQVKQREFKYQEEGKIKTAEAGKIYVYSQTVTIDKVTKGLTIVSFEKRKTAIKNFFDKSISKIDKKTFNTAQNRPVKLGIKYE